VVNPHAQGTLYDPVRVRVDPGRVAAFRRIFRQDEGVPPTYATAVEFLVFPQVIADPRLGLDFTRVVHASQGYVLHRPLREGEELTVTARIDAVRVKGVQGFLTVVMEMVGEDGELACEARSTMIERVVA
jgi:hypothetical protein